MTSAHDAAPLAVTFERSYQATVADLWWLWTTKEGFESWWGPQGFRVAVHRIEPRSGGALVYDMIAAGAAEIEFMKKTFNTTFHATHGSFTTVVPQQYLEIVHVIDFVPGQPTYENRMRVEFSGAGKTARMVIAVEEHLTKEWTQASRQGMESQLTKLPEILRQRRAG
jgi:uncharacterized protein YndB with AHSA1/START domain